MSNIVPRTPNQTINDTEHDLLSKILYRLNLNAGVTPDNPAANVAITNTPLAVYFPVTPNFTLLGQGHVIVDAGTVDANVTNWPAGPFNVNVANTPNVNATVVNTPNVNIANTPNVNATVVGATYQDGHMSTVSVPFTFEVAHEGTYLENGVPKTAFLTRILGRRAGFNSTSVMQDVAEFLGTTTDLLPELNGTENLEIVSSSAQDDPVPAGTGTYTVRVYYLTPTFVFDFEDYTLNGTTPVAIPDKMRFIYGMEALTGGASEVSAGNIDLRIAGGGAVQERITAGGNRSLSARFMIPDNYKGYVCHWSAGSINTTVDFRMRATCLSFSNTLSDRYLFKSNMYLGSGQSSTREIIYKLLPARARLKVSCFPGATAAANRADTEIVVLLVQD